MRFELESSFLPAGDQPDAIEKICEGLQRKKFQTLRGITGSGKTFTLANVIEKVQKPVLLLSHNKTLAAQLFSELKNFFPNNAVEFFISYYDYYLPESYIPQTDTYIAKDSAINEEIEKHRLSATSSLLSRKDVIVVSSVSCIYGLGAPDVYAQMSMKLEVGQTILLNDLIKNLIVIQYERNDFSLVRGSFSVHGDIIEIYPAYKDECYRLEMWGDEIEKISIRSPITKEKKSDLKSLMVFPAKHFVMGTGQIDIAVPKIFAEMEEQVKKFERENKLVEAQRIFQRTNYDMEMLREIGYCSGVENYSLHLSPNRTPGSTPETLMDFFDKDFLLIIDESHVTLPQVRAMFFADQSRKKSLVDYGFRLPSALDNRPLNFQEFEKKMENVIFVSATPASYEMENGEIVLQEIRPTGLLDPEIEVRPLATQIDDLIGEIRIASDRKERILVTTLTKKTAEQLSDYLHDIDIKTKYLHSGIDSIERVEILRGLRAGEFDCLIGVNLLREGLDLPEVALVAILDADKEGFLRSESALFQTAGRAARNLNGRVVMYADKITPAMKTVIETTKKRREKQNEFNLANNITPKSAQRSDQQTLLMYKEEEKMDRLVLQEEDAKYVIVHSIEDLQNEMQMAAEKLDFERAAQLRDQILKMQKMKD